MLVFTSGPILPARQRQYEERSAIAANWLMAHIKRGANLFQNFRAADHRPGGRVFWRSSLADEHIPAWPSASAQIVVGAIRNATPSQIFAPIKRLPPDCGRGGRGGGKAPTGGLDKRLRQCRAMLRQEPGDIGATYRKPPVKATGQAA